MALSGLLPTGTSRGGPSPSRCDRREAKVSHLYEINRRITRHRRGDAPSFAGHGMVRPNLASAAAEPGQAQRPLQLWEMSTVDIQSLEIETLLVPLRHKIHALKVEPL